MSEVKFLKRNSGHLEEEDSSSDSLRVKSLGVGAASPTSGLALANSTPTVAGQIGMAATGRPQIYVSGQARAVATTDDIVGSALAVTQANHGFSTGNAIYYTGSAWAKAKADAAGTLGLGIAIVTDANNFTVYTSGQITGLSGLTAGQYYFVSDATAGSLTTTEPTATTSYSNPLLFALSTTEGFVLSFRPSQVGPSSSDGGWTSVYDVDFTSLANQTFNSATATINGKVWTVTGNANLGGSIVNGTGMVFTPVAGQGVYTGILIKLSDLTGSLTGTCLRLRVQSTRSGGLNASNTNYSHFWVQWDGSLTMQANNNRTSLGHESESSTLRILYLAYNNAGQNNSQQNNASDDAFMITYEGVAASLYSGVYSGGWPNPGAMRMRGVDAGLAPIFAYSPPLALGDISIGWLLFSGSSPNFTETITRLQIEVK